MPPMDNSPGSAESRDNSSNSPEATNSSTVPGALESANSAKAPTSSNSPETPNSSISSESPKLANSSKSSEAPDSANSSISPEASNSSISPEALESANSSEATNSSNSLEAPNSANSSEAPKSANSSNSSNSPETPDSANSSNSPESPNSSNSPETSTSNSRSSSTGTTSGASQAWTPNPRLPAPDYASFRPLPFPWNPDRGFLWGETPVIFIPPRTSLSLQVDTWGSGIRRRCFPADFLERALAAFPSYNGPHSIHPILNSALAMGPVTVDRYRIDEGAEYHEWYIGNEPVFRKNEAGICQPTSSKVAMLINAILFHLERQHEKEDYPITDERLRKYARHSSRLKVCPLAQPLRPDICVRPWHAGTPMIDPLPFDVDKPEIVLYNSRALRTAQPAHTEVHLPQGTWQPQDLLSLHHFTLPKVLTLRQALCWIFAVPPSHQIATHELTADLDSNLWYRRLVEPTIRGMMRVRAQQQLTLAGPRERWAIAYAATRFYPQFHKSDGCVVCPPAVDAELEPLEFFKMLAQMLHQASWFDVKTEKAARRRAARRQRSGGEAASA